MSLSPPLRSVNNNGVPSSASRFRKLVPAPGSTYESTGSGSDQGPPLLSYLRPRAKQTKIACESCRKLKAKACFDPPNSPSLLTQCGGQRPKCKGCINKDIQCHYQASQWDLKRKYDEIQERSSLYEQFCLLLTCLPEREAQSIFRRLREGADVATTMHQVQEGDLPLQPAWAPETRLHYELPCSTSMPTALLSPDSPYLGSTIFEVTDHALPLSPEQTEAWVNEFETMNMAPDNIAELMDPCIRDIQVSKWTSVEADDELLRTLLRSYFLHDYANYTCFQKDIFLQAMRDSDTQFCSPLLVNAVLAEACHSYRNATHRAWRSENLGYTFLTEAKRLLELESSQCKLTTLHAAMVLHTIYTMNGMDQVGISYLLQSVQIAQDLKLFAPEQTEGKTKTARVFTAWALYRWQSLQAFHNLRAPLIRGHPATPMPDPDREPLWYGELWLRYPPSLKLVPMHFGYVYQAQTELRRIANGITCIRFTGQKTARSLPASDLDRLQRVLDDWYIGLPEPIKSHRAVLPSQLIMHMEYCVLLFKVAQMAQEIKPPLTPTGETVDNNTQPCKTVEYALRCLETVLRLYHLRHTFEHGDTYLTYFLSILAYSTTENMNRNSISPDDVKTLETLRATLLLAVKGLYDQGQHVYVSSAMCRLIRDRMTKEDMSALRRYTTWKDDQPPVPHYVRSTFPVTVVMLEEDWKLETVEILAKKYDQLAFEANEGDSSAAITPDKNSEQAG
ncbi:C6 transcription factor [Fusarium denticulatum]|uniref:C6 transcription factor n=1 Tax=Fusarium denticulatum TaxID=48507 RepID=A0A8H5XG56_9HYPO|nr:C6 transcription factor [Fusarium denticulatum]